VRALQISQGGLPVSELSDTQREALQGK